MKFSKILRQNMLETVAKPAIMSGSCDQLIKFYASGDPTPICTVQFYNMTSVLSGIGEDAAHVFNGQDGLDLLIGAVTGSGTVSRFEIQAEVDSVVVDNAISGSVGSKTSTADLKFGIVNWEPGMTVTIKKMLLRIRQGL